MMKALLNHLYITWSMLFFCIIIISISCSGVNIADYTKCEEVCEYARRDCIESCGGYNTFGFSYDFGSSEIKSPYVCSDKCEVKAKRCLDLCKDRSN
ncbi:MAG: hypothetical protein FWF73_00365 [Spirochaetes bacterium]|nr:hypothetical protein [Spirochaetota bacterium]